jgi:hypothetical protein
MTACIEHDYIDRHFAGTIAPADERAMREHMPACALCRAHYGRWLLLSKLDPTALPAKERIARGLGVRRPQPLRRVVSFGALPVLAMAAALILWLRASPGGPGVSPGGTAADGFTARGGAHAEAASRVYVYEVRPGAAPALAGDTIGRHAELAFAYENGAAKNRVMVFGEDEHGHVYWFYPAWSNEAENPVAVPIAADGRRHELPDAIRHDLDGTRLEIHALFVDRPVSVREMEALIHDRAAGDLRNGTAPLALPGSVEDHASFTLAP